MCLSFNFGETEKGSGECVGTLAGQDLGLGNNTWLLGDRYVPEVVENRRSLLTIWLHTTVS